MKILKSSAILVVSFLIFFIIPSFAENNESSIASRSIKLGAIVSLTGDASRNGLNWFEGANLALDELKTKGEAVELIIEDDATVPAKVASAFVKLATVNKVDGIIGGTWDFLAETAYPLAKQYQVPFITPTNPVEVLSSPAKKNPWIFTNGLSLAAERKEIRTFLRTSKVDEIGLVYINVPYGEIHADLLREIAKEEKLKIKIEAEISYQGFRDDIKLAALKFSKEKPDLVFVVLNYEGVDLLLRNFESFKFSPIVLMTHTLKEALNFGKSKTRYQKAFGILPKFTSTRFETAFMNKFNHPAYGYAAAGYDALMFMYRLALKRRSKGLEKIELNYQGITGLHRLPNLSPGIVETEAMIMTARNGIVERYIIP